MANNLFGEKWKEIQFEIPLVKGARIEVSNMGRIRTFNSLSDGNILQGSMINGYRIFRLKLYTPRKPSFKKQIDYLQEQVNLLSQKLEQQIKNKRTDKTIAATSQLLSDLKKNVKEKMANDVKARTTHYHKLFHKAVAEYFLPKPKKGQTIVAHLDYDKTNNQASNLRWMTPEENQLHQRSSPYVIKEKAERKDKRRLIKHGPQKLTVTRVMLLKKHIAEGRPMKQLVKQYKVTETQIYRIKRGENWADIPAFK